jgi:hypothetical protein
LGIVSSLGRRRISPFRRLIQHNRPSRHGRPSGKGAKSRGSAMSPLLVRKGLRSTGHAPAELCMLDHPPDGARAASNCLILGIIWGRSMRMTLTDVRPSGSDPRTQDDRCRRCRRAICCRGTTVSKISRSRCQPRGC